MNVNSFISSEKNNDNRNDDNNNNDDQTFEDEATLSPSSSQFDSLKPPKSPGFFSGTKNSFYSNFFHVIFLPLFLFIFCI